MKNMTLCVIIDQKKEKILLALKKRGFAANLWNSPGGKVKDGETIEEAAIRETEEEIGLKVIKIKPIGGILFKHPFNDSLDDLMVYYFRALEWNGKVEESEEMLPKWFDFADIPYDKMFPDDTYWLPEVLKGKNVKGEVAFDNDLKIIKKKFEFYN